MFTRIYIDNYRCFSNFEFKPAQVNLIVGENGSGKSSIVDLIGAIQDIIVYQHHAETCFPAKTLTKWDKRTVQTFELDVKYENKSYEYVLVIDHSKNENRAIIAKETVSLNGVNLYSFIDGNVQLKGSKNKEGKSFSFKPEVSYLGFIDSNSGLEELINFVSVMYMGISRLRVDPKKISSKTETENEGLHHSASNFASWYRSAAQESPEQISEVFASIAKAVRGFKGIKLRSVEGESRHRQLFTSFTANSGGQSVSYDIMFEDLSDGQKVLIVLYTMFRFRIWSDRAVFFDEPDNFLSLSEVQPCLIELADRAREVNAQLFVVSHHPEVIDYLAADHAVLFSRKGGGPVRVSSLLVDLNSGLKASEIIARRLHDDE